MLLDVRDTEFSRYRHIPRWSTSIRIQWYSNTEVTVQLAPSAPCEPYSESRFLVLNNLRLALHEDPDLADIKRPALTSVLQTVFVATGCDYVSFFARIGKATFLDTLFQSASFITGSSMADHGTLTDQDHNKSMMAFYRLVAQPTSRSTALHLNTSHQKVSSKPLQRVGSSHTQHVHFLKSIRDTIWARVPFEDEMPPSSGAQIALVEVSVGNLDVESSRLAKS